MTLSILYNEHDGTLTEPYGFIEVLRNVVSYCKQDKNCPTIVQGRKKDVIKMKKGSNMKKILVMGMVFAMTSLVFASVVSAKITLYGIEGEFPEGGKATVYFFSEKKRDEVFESMQKAHPDWILKKVEKQVEMLPA